MIPSKSVSPALSRLQKLVLVLSFTLFLLSLFQPAFYIDRKDYDAYADGKFLVLLGWMSFLGGNFIASLIWLANPCFIIALLLILKHKPAGFYLSIIACLLALGFSILDSTMTSEAGNYSKIISLESGYKLWVMGMIVLTIGTGIDKVASKTS